MLGIVVLLVAASLGSVLLADGRAQDAADAAALAAAHARHRAVAPAVAAREAAGVHGATLVRCSCGGAVVEVSVRVEVDATAVRSVGISHRVASASARLVPSIARS